MNAPELLTAFESCRRKAYWLKSWEPHRMTAIHMTQKAVLEALAHPLADPGEDLGQFAGDTVMGFAADRGLIIPDPSHIHRSAVNHAAIADIVTSTIRKPSDPAWRTESQMDEDGLRDSCFMDSTGTFLRHFIPVTAWGEERQTHEVRSWHCLGQVCQWKMPMQLVVAVLGPVRLGRRSNPWSRGLLHPMRSHLRFKLRNRGMVDGFKETWTPVVREEHAEIDRSKWMQAMLDDGVLRELLFSIEIPVPSAQDMRAIRELRKRQTDKLLSFIRLPGKQLSTCDGPLVPCPFRSCCWSSPESVPDDGGFDRVF